MPPSKHAAEKHTKTTTRGGRREEEEGQACGLLPCKRKMHSVREAVAAVDVTLRYVAKNTARTLDTNQTQWRC